jgi:hypothetical protein
MFSIGWWPCFSLSWGWAVQAQLILGAYHSVIAPRRKVWLLISDCRFSILIGDHQSTIANEAPFPAKLVVII